MAFRELLVVLVFSGAVLGLFAVVWVCIQARRAEVSPVLTVTIFAIFSAALIVLAAAGYEWHFELQYCTYHPDRCNSHG